MRRLCFILISVLLLPFARCEVQAYTTQKVYHFFTHALLADKHLAFDDNNPMRNDYDRDCITAYEFKTILKELYDKDFVLVDVYDVYQNGAKKIVDLPKGKKPMILSFDDINYYVKKMHLGMNDKLIVDSHGAVASEINGTVNYDNEVVTCLENFIIEYPDFSFRGAKGIICLTGFDGILGYRTNMTNPKYKSERIMAKQVVTALKNSGWRFACHSYGHRHMKKINDELFANDTFKWSLEVGTLTGTTDLYCYPYGEWAMDGKQKLLIESGYKLFFGVGLEPYYSYMSLDSSKEKCLFMDRIPLDGRTLRMYKDRLKEYFDVEKVYDISRFIPLETF